MKALWHVYRSGRMGFEKHLGFVWADLDDDGFDWIKQSSYIWIDLVWKPGWNYCDLPMHTLLGETALFVHSGE